MEIIKKALSELHKTEKNIRKHSPKQIEEYVRSLKMFGQIRPLVVTEDGEILAGNGMYDALVSMGADSCDVYVVSGLSANQKKKLILADNKIYELGATDLFTFNDIIKDLDGDFDVPGWDDELLRALTATRVEISRSVMEYGKSEAVVENEEAPEDFRHSDGGSTEPQTQYAPVVRDEETGAIKPPEPERPFVICPKCGEKIWL